MGAREAVARALFEAMAKRGQMRQALDDKTAFQHVLKGKVPATDLEISGAGHPLGSLYETGRLTQRLDAAGMPYHDDRMGRVVIGQTPEALQALKNAQTPVEHGFAYGYTPDDIARFYAERRGGNYDLAYPDFTKDWEK